MTAITAPEVSSSSRFNAAVIARHIGRVLLGGLFTFSSVMFFLMPTPPAPEGQAGVFVAGLAAAGYLMPLVKIVELISGLALLSNRFVPLALVLLAPITVNILGVHSTVLPSGLPVAIVIIAIQLALAWSHRAAFAPMLRAKN
ncbi:MAG: DoxX family protein [Archangium sp.]|nr:DoxX family protein [Archangium sp.]